MDTVTFWKHYGRELEEILDNAHKAEAKRFTDAILKGNHHITAEESHNFEKLRRLQMIRSVVINMNRDENVDSQRPLKP